jgi:hypothetical protein
MGDHCEIGFSPEGHPLAQTRVEAKTFAEIVVCPEPIDGGFIRQGEEMFVTGDATFKGRSLEGKKCAVLRHAVLRSGERNQGRKVFVEFFEDVGGCGCDGLGAKGRCVMIDERNLSRKAPTKLREEKTLYRKFK